MKHSVKRMLSVVLVLLLCLNLFSGLTFAATVDYQTGDPDGFPNVILNWGTRGTTATFLSPNAQVFYSDNNVTYSDLIQHTGAANIADVPDSDLYTTLQSLMTSNHSVITSYADTRHLYSYTDCQASTRSKLTCFYSGISIGPDWDSGATWNREHTWPNSKGLEGDDENDIMMLRPASTSVNSSRGNKAYGISDGFFDPNSVSNGAYDLHGDVARIALYVYVRWSNTELLLGADGMIESLDLLLQWMEEDPVDTWEMGRNDAVESITGTRNVFVDYPELAFALFDQAIPSDMTTPSGEAINSDLAYTITAVSNNDAWGTVSLSGKTINAVPAAGYRVAGYSVVSGDAAVTGSGNAFTVNPSSDCTIQINFEAKTSTTVSFSENGTQTGSQSVYTGDVYTLPESSITAPEGYTFQGWVTNELTQTTEKPATIYAPGASVTAEGDAQYYALYTRLDTQGSGSSTAYELYAGALVPGNYLVTYENGAMKASLTKSRMDFTMVTPVGNTVDDPSASIIWKLDITNDGYVTLYNESTSSYAGGTGAKNKAGLLSSMTDYAKWTVTGDTVYDFVNLGNANKGVNKTLRRNADSGFACYAESTGGSLTLYKQANGTVYYSTIAAACQHQNVKTEAALAPTCTEIGYTEGTYCEDCKSYISGHEELAATGHSYESVVTPPTVTEGGYTTYTCTACGDTYTGDFTEALGEQFNVSFVVPEGVEPIADQLCGNSGITLPTAGVPAGAEGYSFVGWVDAQVADTDVAPTIYTGTFTTTAETTLYALYTYVTGASDTVSWKLVADASELAEGDHLIMAQTSVNKVASDIYSQYLSDADAAFSEDGSEITQLPESALILTLGQSEGFWTLTNAAGQMLGVTGAKKLAWDRGTYGFSISIDENSAATVSSSDETFGRFLYNVNNPRFTVYTSNTSVSMLLPNLYKLVGSLGTTYYTTSVSLTACDHSYEANVTAPTCTEAGYTTYTCTLCGSSYQSDEIAATGHSYESVVTEPTVTEQGYTTYTCTACGDSYVSDYVDALGETYLVSFVVPEGMEAIAPMECNKTGITLPTAGVPEYAEGYSFAGWVDTQLDNSDIAPVIYTGTFTAEANTTLYALYTYSTGGSGDAAWTLVTDAATLTAGDQLVLAQNEAGTVAGDITKQYMDKLDGVFSEDLTGLTELPTGAVVLTLGGSEGAWTFANSDGALLGATTVKKLAWDNGTTTWTITIDEAAGATIQNGTDTYGRFLYNVSSPRFTTYTSNTSTGMLLPNLYKLAGGLGTTYYTTVLEAPEQGVTVSGTVTAAGTVTVELANDTGSYVVTTEDGVYTIENVAEGTYTMTVSADGYVTRTYEITVGTEAVTQDGKLCVKGDITGDGKVNVMDVARIYTHAKGGKQLTDYAFACADMTGDGKVNVMDTARAYKLAKA